MIRYPMKAIRFTLLSGMFILLVVPAQAQVAAPNATDEKILIHVTQGPENPTAAALAFLVAKAAIEEGHSVTLFLAGDAVQLMRDGVLNSLSGVGTGQLREHYEAIVQAGSTFYLSGMSSRARGLTEADVEGKPVEFAPPHVLVQLALEHDRMFTY